MARRQPQRQTPAERMRRHNEIFQYALAHGLSLHEAERRLARARYLALIARIERRRHGHDDKVAPSIAPWMMRD